MLAEVPDLEWVLFGTNRAFFGLRASVLSRDLIGRAKRASSMLEVAGVIVDDVLTWRADAVPHERIENRGIGLGGPHHAIDALRDWQPRSADPGQRREAPWRVPKPDARLRLTRGWTGSI